MRGLCFALLCTFGVGCLNHAFAPPLRTLPLESPGALARGETGVQVDGSGTGTSYEGEIDTGTLRVRHGFGEGIEGSIETSVLYYQTLALQPRYAFATRLGVKYCVRFSGCPLALIGGAGGGAFDRGGIVGGDLGVILGYDNRYFVPFFSLRATTTGVIGGAPVYDGDACFYSASLPPCPVYNTPVFSYGLFASLGFRVPISLGDESGARLHLVTAVQLGTLQDEHAGATVASVGGGLELTFGGPKREAKPPERPDSERARRSSNSM